MRGDILTHIEIGACLAQTKTIGFVLCLFVYIVGCILQSTVASGVFSNSIALPATGSLTRDLYAALAPVLDPFELGQ